MIESRITRSESMSLWCIANNSNALKLSQIQYYSPYLDLANCNIGKTIKTVRGSTHYICVVKKMKPILMSDRSTPNVGLYCGKRAIAQAIPIPRPWCEWLIAKFF